MTSDSAKTVHILEMFISVVDFWERGPISLMSTSSTLAMTSRKRPVPAAHLSFMQKSTTLGPLGPSVVRATALLSCPPMSMIVLVLGNR